MEVQFTAYSPSIGSTAFRRHASMGGIRIAPSSTDATQDDESLRTIQQNEGQLLCETDNRSFSSFRKAFEEDLGNSRPYIRASKRKSALSLSSSAIHTTGLSFLSGLSLADVSDISVINLLVSSQDMWNGHHYIYQHDDSLAASPDTTENDRLQSFHSLASDPMLLKRGTALKAKLKKLLNMESAASAENQWDDICLGDDGNTDSCPTGILILGM